MVGQMDRATSEVNETKSKVKQPSDMPTPRFEHGWWWLVVQHATARPRGRPILPVSNQIITWLIIAVALRQLSSLSLYNNACLSISNVLVWPEDMLLRARKAEDHTVSHPHLHDKVRPMWYFFFNLEQAWFTSSSSLEMTIDLITSHQHIDI